MQEGYWKNRVREGAVLSPVDRTSEVLFGLIMVLTFTGAISVASGRNDVRELLWAALGCNLAWGLVDAIMYWMNLMLERGHALKAILALRKTDAPAEAKNILSEFVPPVLAGLMNEEDFRRLHEQLKKLPEPGKKDLLTLRDIWSGTQIFLLVFLCTLPVALPFGFIADVATAMRVSNGIALLFLFAGGIGLGHYAGFRPLLTGVAYAFIGVCLVGLTVALGG